MQCALVALMLAVPPLDSMADEDPFRDLDPMPDSALDTARGGFRIGAFDILLGLTIQTLVDGSPVVENHFSVQSDGSLVPFVPNQITTLDNRLPTVVGSGAITIGPDGIAVADGVSMPLDGPGTMIIENTRNGVAIAQRMEMTIVMENMEAIAQAGRTALRMNDIARASALVNGGHQ